MSVIAHQVVNATRRARSVNPTYLAIGPLAEGRIVAVEFYVAWQQELSSPFADYISLWGWVLSSGPTADAATYAAGQPLIRISDQTEVLGGHPAMGGHLGLNSGPSFGRLTLSVPVIGGAHWVLWGAQSGHAQAVVSMYSGVIVERVTAGRENGVRDAEDERNGE